VHSLRGMCANIGAVGVADEASSLELCLESESLQELDALFDSFRDAFEAMLGNIGRLQSSAPAAGGEVLDEQSLVLFLEELLPGLRSRTPLKCQAAAARLGGAVVSPAFRDEVARICALTDQYNFVPALKLTEQVLDKIRKEE
jgi:HPt (histidine-containing phosphotransfer) domain-containing protein